jgi:glutaredoxin-related protein
MRRPLFSSFFELLIQLFSFFSFSIRLFKKSAELSTRPKQWRWSPTAARRAPYCAPRRRAAGAHARAPHRASSQCCVLYTSGTNNQLFTTAWHRLETILDGRGLTYDKIDGADPEMKEVRGALWEISGDRKYPQVFVEGKFIGDADQIQARPRARPRTRACSSAAARGRLSAACDGCGRTGAARHGHVRSAVWQVHHQVARRTRWSAVALH